MTKKSNAKIEVVSDEQEKVEASSTSESAENAEASKGGLETIVVERRERVGMITLHRPKA